MLTLYSYPELFGVADNNPYGLKIFAFLRLAGVPFRHEHIFDASSAPRGQLPYIVDDGEAIGDSDTIIAHLIRKYRLTNDSALTAQQRDITHLTTRITQSRRSEWPLTGRRARHHRPAKFDVYLRQVLPMIERFGGRYLTRAASHEVLDGHWRPDRVVVIEFPDMASIRALYHYQPLIALRRSAATDVIIAVEGK
jgi:uncharacterized protein (DUF1330 family)